MSDKIPPTYNSRFALVQNTGKDVGKEYTPRYDPIVDCAMGVHIHPNEARPMVHTVIDRDGKVDYYANRYDMQQAFIWSALTPGHTYVTLDERTRWKLSPGRDGFIEIGRYPVAFFDNVESIIKEKWAWGFHTYMVSLSTGEVFESDSTDEFIGVVGHTSKKIFPGERLFQLKATHGVPLENALHLLLNREEGRLIDWAGFVKEARLNGWYDFQIIDVVDEALTEVVDHDYRDGIIQRMKGWIMSNPGKTNRTSLAVEEAELHSILKEHDILIPHFLASCRGTLVDGVKMWSRNEIEDTIKALKNPDTIQVYLP